MTDTIVSPSFVLMAEYEGRLPLFHLDPYRLADAADALAGGLIDERQADGRDPRRVAGAARRRPARRRGSTCASTAAATTRGTITLVAGTPDYERYLDASRSGR